MVLPWVYVESVLEIERGAQRLVMNISHWTKALKWIKYPTLSKKDLLNKLYETKVSSKFDMKNWYWQI